MTKEFTSCKDTDEYAIISSFGKCWQRNTIKWTMSPEMHGIKRIGGIPVNFGKQVGFYILYSGDKVIYLGSSKEKPIARCLYEHTLDRLSARWDSFSWFGLLPVSDGQLGEMPETFNLKSVIPALQAIIIETLEVRQIRDSGNDLSAVEYIQ
jgi:hypothetical protein